MSFKIKKIRGKGRAVIAQKTFRKGAVVMEQEILPFPHDEPIGEFLDNYIYECGGVHYLCLGMGSLLNHSNTPNLSYALRKKQMKLFFYADMHIKKGDELTIDYEWPSYPWE